MITVYVINLEEDMERFNRIKEQLSAITDFDVLRSAGVKGSSLPAIAADVLAHAPNYKQIGHGVLGVFLAHVAAWERVSNAPTRYSLIIEDDAQFDRIDLLTEDVLPSDADVIFCNDRMRPALDVTEHSNGLVFLSIEHALKGLAARKSNSVGADGYVLSKVGASKLLGRVAQDWFFGHVDWRLLRYCVSRADLENSIDGTEVANIIATHHLKSNPPAWGILKAYTLSRPIINHAWSLSRRNAEDQLSRSSI
jgi:GR25 family glycosyltransferase involved in LPS biosynthesis